MRRDGQSIKESTNKRTFSLQIRRLRGAVESAIVSDVDPKSVLITGTSSGIGRALLEHYVAAGVKVVSVNRRAVPELESRHPAVRFERVDVRVAAEVERLVRELAAAGQLPEVVILNAGINRLDNDAAFDLAAFREVVDTNLYGAVNFVAPLTALPAGAARRHVIAVGSMVNYAGNPYAVGYHASKKALAACFDTWSRMYAGTDLVFQQLVLGPVPTGIHTTTDRLPPWMGWVRRCFSGSLEGTVRAIAKLARTRKRRRIYPWRAWPLFIAFALAQRFIPGCFQGRKTLDGGKRRTGEH
jgi:NAD(P)-dependent dehydrogenase (short-subunit alcohol dehydrogenase family)